jgi:GT2 family glycosyltransferase
MRVGVVVIGRNEERTLARSLSSVTGHAPALVYVDSASTDGSVAVAEGLNVPVVRLGTGGLLSAAAGRNAGRAYLRERFPDLEYIQFVDGDTELAPDWIDIASKFLDENSHVGMVAGRLRERCRERNVYHRLADMEFDTRTGDVDAVGGIAMHRASAFDLVKGFDAAVVSGEERELGGRLALHGLRVYRIADTMGWHDIHMDEIGQWLRRTRRAGFTLAEHFVDRRIMGKNVASALAWGGIVPTVALGMALPTLGGSLALLGAYPVLWRRVRSQRLRAGSNPRDAALYASATVLGKIPEAIGVLDFARARLFGPSMPPRRTSESSR